jgi:citrate lyase subunit beta/citryl-CoA lyase
MSHTIPERCRSFLFVPGNKPERFEKAIASGADAVIIDLEDAVAPDQKNAAREAVAAWANPSGRVYIRVNGKGTPWFEQDALLCKLPGVQGVVLPKAETTSDVTDLVALARKKTAVFPLIESAEGLWNALDIAKAPCVQQLMFGTLDFMLDMKLDLTNGDLNIFRAELAKASRVAQIAAPIDGVTTEIDDMERLSQETLNGKRWGFIGKLCIHPRQVATVNRSYAPSESELEWARRVVDAAQAVGGAAVSLDGQMVDRPVVLHAQRLLASMA